MYMYICCYASLVYARAWPSCRCVTINRLRVCSCVFATRGRADSGFAAETTRQANTNNDYCSTNIAFYAFNSNTHTHARKRESENNTRQKKTHTRVQTPKNVHHLRIRRAAVCARAYARAKSNARACLRVSRNPQPRLIDSLSGRYLPRGRTNQDAKMLSSVRCVWISIILRQLPPARHTKRSRWKTLHVRVIPVCSFMPEPVRCRVRVGQINNGINQTTVLAVQRCGGRGGEGC